MLELTDLGAETSTEEADDGFLVGGGSLEQQRHVYINQPLQHDQQGFLHNKIRLARCIYTAEQ